MKISFNFAAIILLLCTILRHETEAGVVTEKVESIVKIYSTGEQFRPNFVRHNGTRYQVHQRGPCGKLMWIENEHGRGVCRCINTPLGIRPLIFWQPTNRCYFEYDQGPCETKEWVIRNSDTKQVECQPNPCPASKLEKDSNIDIESLIELETDYYFVDESDNATCLRNKVELKSWHVNTESQAVSRFVYHDETQKYFPRNERGPCPPLMQFDQKDWHLYENGKCSCKIPGSYQRPIVYWQKTDRCYFTYTQGPCKSDEWIVGSVHKAVCQRHKCPTSPTVNNKDDEIDEVLKPDRQFFIQDSNGTCYETNTRAFCSCPQKLFIGITLLFGDGLQCLALDKDWRPIFGNDPNDECVGLTEDKIHSCEEGYTLDESNNCVQENMYD